MASLSGVAHDAFVSTVCVPRTRKPLARALSLTEGTLTMAVRGVTSAGDRGDRGALLAVAVRLYPGPYDAAAVLDVPAAELAVYGEALLAALGRPV